MPPFAALFALGATALAVAVAVLPQMFAVGSGDGGFAMLAQHLAVQLALLALAVLIGCRLAPQVGLRSHAARLAPPWQRREVGVALLAGVVVGMVVVAVTWLVGRPTEGALPVGPLAVLRLELTRAVYFGIFNELVMRWGAMTFLSLAVAALFRRTAGPTRGDHLVAAVGAAILGTVPFLLASPASTPAVVSVLMTHFVPAVVCGWIYARWSLEAAMIARAVPHVLLALALAGGVVASR